MPAFINLDYDILRYLLEHGAPPDQVQEDQESFTPLTFYANEGSVRELELLIQFGANVNAQLDGMPILSYLLRDDNIQDDNIQKEQIATAELLFNAGAPVTAEERTKLLNLLKRG